MSQPILAWTGLAVLLFWGVGAYNRLVRLRADIKVEFAAFDAQCQQQLALVRAHLPEVLRDTSLTQPGALMDDTMQCWAALAAAGQQVETSFAAMRPRSMQPEAASALAAAQGVLATAWQRLQRDAHDLAGAALPDTVAQQWTELATATQKAQGRFNDAIARYNAAIAQFPALLLAWLFGFRRAAPV